MLESSRLGWLKGHVVHEARALYAPSDDKDAEAPAFFSWRGFQDCLNALSRGVSQVCFISNPFSGLICWIALMIPTTPAYRLYVTVGLFVETLTAYCLLPRLKQGRDLIRYGLFGYDACLVGAALATFLVTGPEATSLSLNTWRTAANLFLVVIGSALACVIKLALGNAWGERYQLPTFTMGFNLSTFVLLAAINGLSKGNQGLAIFTLAPGIGDSGVVAAFNNGGLAPAGSPPISFPAVCFPSGLNAAADPNDGCVGVVIKAIFRGVAQVYFCDNWISGLFLVLAFALCSPISAFGAFFGSAVGFATGLLFGASPADLVFGLYGYNSVIGVQGLLAMFRCEWRTFVAATICAVACTLVQGMFKTVFAPFAMPVLTIPFCTSAIFMLLLGWPERVMLKDASVPEDHLVPNFGCKRLHCSRDTREEKSAVEGQSNGSANINNNSNPLDSVAGVVPARSSLTSSSAAAGVEMSLLTSSDKAAASTTSSEAAGDEEQGSVREAESETRLRR